MPYEENFFRADWLSLGESGFSCGHGRLFCEWGFLGAAVTCAGLVRDSVSLCHARTVRRYLVRWVK